MMTNNYDKTTPYFDYYQTLQRASNLSFKRLIFEILGSFVSDQGKRRDERYALARVKLVARGMHNLWSSGPLVLGAVEPFGE